MINPSQCHSVEIDIDPTAPDPKTRTELDDLPLRASAEAEVRIRLGIRFSRSQFAGPDSISVSARHIFRQMNEHGVGDSRRTPFVPH